MRKGKVSFLWDVGSGVGRVEYPDLTIDDSSWYRIEASRYLMQQQLRQILEWGSYF